VESEKLKMAKTTPMDPTLKIAATVAPVVSAVSAEQLQASRFGRSPRGGGIDEDRPFVGLVAVVAAIVFDRLLLCPTSTMMRRLVGDNQDSAGEASQA